MKVFSYLALILMLANCASTKKKVKGVRFVQKSQKHCQTVAKLSSSGFSIIPYVGKYLAKGMLETKGKDLRADTIVIDSEEGIFMIDMQATGYRCLKS